MYLKQRYENLPFAPSRIVPKHMHVWNKYIRLESVVLISYLILFLKGQVSHHFTAKNVPILFVQVSCYVFSVKFINWDVLLSIGPCFENIMWKLSSRYSLLGINRVSVTRIILVISTKKTKRYKYKCTHDRDVTLTRVLIHNNGRLRSRASLE